MPLIIVAIFYPFSQFCEIDICLPSLEKQPKRAPNLFQRGVEYGKWVSDNTSSMFKSFLVIVSSILITSIISTVAVPLSLCGSTNVIALLVKENSLYRT